MSAALKLVIFDVDGTLIDSQDAIISAMEIAFTDMGLPVPSRQQVLQIVGLSLHEAVALLVPEADEAMIARGAQSYRSAFLAQRQAKGAEAVSPLYPGARAAVEALHARDELLLGVATGKARRGLDHAFAAHDLDRFFVTRQTADTHPSKPHPSMIHAALSETGVASGDAVMVGDTSFDIEMARAAGIAAIGVSWGYHPPGALIAAGAAHVITDFADLPGAVDQVWRQAV